MEQFRSGRNSEGIFKMLEINKIYNADCLKLMKQLPDKCVDLVLTDPPYLYKKMGGTGSFLENSVKKIATGLSDIQDGFDIDIIFNEFKRITKKFNLFCFCSNEQVSDIMAWGKKNKFYTTCL